MLKLLDATPAVLAAVRTTSALAADICRPKVEGVVAVVDTRTATNGAHTLTAVARDAAGNTTTSAPVAVNVANTSFFQNEILATGLSLPTAMKFLPDGRMLVAELEGTVRVLSPPYTQTDRGSGSSNVAAGSCCE